MKADQFRTRRKALGMTQKQIAPLLGVVTRTVRLWEAGERAVPRYAVIILDLREQLPEGDDHADLDGE